MKLYFVRHGETQFNAKNIHQHNDVPLSQHGLQQAKFVANRFREIPVDVIISSDVMRAQQTTEEIAKVIKKQIFYTPLLRERKTPTELQGLAWDNPAAVKIKDLLNKNMRLTDWHYSDEENFFDFKKRGLEFFDYLSLFKEENLLAVSHGKMISLIVSLLIFGQEMTYKEHNHFMETFTLSNTGITLCEQTPSGLWRLITWNDYAHLG